ncbi:DUF99 family protein [Sulfolobus sp. S-194]|nr:DUF99 family protein [Sulfolobus sp. S-194]
MRKQLLRQFLKKIVKLLVSGIDDGYFPLKYKGRKGRTVMLSVVFKNYDIIDVDFDFIFVDGDEGTSVLNSLQTGDVCILDGLTFGGFNFVNPNKLKSKYIIFYSSKPNILKITRALDRHFNDERRDIILNVIANLTRVSTLRGDVYIYTNLDLKYAKNIIEEYQVFDRIPLPLKIAHEISSSLSTFLLSKKII